MHYRGWLINIINALNGSVKNAVLFNNWDLGVIYRRNNSRLYGYLSTRTQKKLEEIVQGIVFFA
jgi:hypothetical protein